jgi:Glycosyltransferases involved in cell wall biogenesis
MNEQERRKVISIMIPCYNEEENARQIYQAVKNELETSLPQYDYEILFIDNKSKDHTREIIRDICAHDQKVRAIFNCRNFGQFNSPYYGILNTSGDCTITICADFQDPVEMIPKFVHEWEQGYKIVCGIKTSSKENRLVYGLRSAYYKIIKRMSQVDQIEHFTGFGLYDKSFVNTLRDLRDPTPFIRGIVAELRPERKEIAYEQPKRKAGKTHNNWYSLYDAAMLSFTSYTKIGLRLAVFAGGIFSCLGLLVALVYLIMKLIFWDRFIAGQAPILIGIFLLGAIQLFFIGLLGEYILSINNRVMNRPLVVEEERLNFDTNNRTECADEKSSETKTK